MSDNSQLFKKENNGYKEVYPLSYIQNIIDAETKEKLSDILIRYNHIYVPWQDNVTDTRLSVPKLMRRKGLWISYDKEGTLYTEYFKLSTLDAMIDSYWESDDNWETVPNLEFVRNEASKLPDGIVTPEKLSPALQELIKQNNNITNLPDDEDLEEKCGVIKFKDRDYNPYISSGKGYKILRKNWVSGYNVLTQNMINKENTIYEIRYDFDLRGEEITIPEGCTLKFEGGSFKNGKIVFNNTIIKGEENIFINIDFSGSLSIIKLSWFDNDNYLLVLNNIGNTILNNGIIHIDKNISINILANDDIGLNISNKENIIIINPNSSVITVNPNQFRYYRVVQLSNCNNTIIENIIINGDRLNHDYTTESGTHEFGYGICIQNDENINDKSCLLKNCKVYNMTGDAYYIHGTENNITIENCEGAYCRRQGISVINCKELTIDNCLIHHIGTYDNIQGAAPMCGIDLEPEPNNHPNLYIRNAIIKNTHIYETTKYSITAQQNNTEKITIDNCILGTNIYFSPRYRNKDNTIINNCKCTVNDTYYINAYIKNTIFEYTNNDGVHDKVVDLIDSLVVGSSFKYKENIEGVGGNIRSSQNCEIYNSEIINLGGFGYNEIINIYGIQLFKGKFINCSFSNSTFSSSSSDLSYSIIRSTFKNCTIKSFPIGTIIESCIFDNSSVVIDRKNIKISNSQFIFKDNDKRINIGIDSIFTNCYIKYNYTRDDYYLSPSNEELTFINSTIDTPNFSFTKNNNNINLINSHIFSNNIDICHIGTSSFRPIYKNPDYYFDTTINKPIWWTGSKWVDATGADV